MLFLKVNIKDNVKTALPVRLQELFICNCLHSYCHWSFDVERGFFTPSSDVMPFAASSSFTLSKYVGSGYPNLEDQQYDMVKYELDINIEVHSGYSLDDFNLVARLVYIELVDTIFASDIG